MNLTPALICDLGGLPSVEVLTRRVEGGAKLAEPDNTTKRLSDVLPILSSAGDGEVLGGG